MNKKIALVFLICILLVLQTFAHDLFLKLDNFQVGAGEKINIKILNGSFMDSEGAVNFARLSDVSVIDPTGEKKHPQESDFTKNENTSFMSFVPEKEGTYIAGLSTMRRDIALEAEDFNGYLEEDGIPDVLAARKLTKTLDKNVREWYSKHVKIVFQAGKELTDNYKAVLGYPVEIIPVKNPYSLKAGETFEFQCLKDGKPLANQYVMSGYEDLNGKLVVGENIRTDKDGIGKVTLDAPGKWYVKFIQMEAAKEPDYDFESKWATLTFGVK